MKRWFASCTVFVSAVLFFSSHVFAQADLYEKGLRAYEKKDYRSAVKHLKEYVSRKPDANAEAYYLLGYADYMVKRKAGKAGKDLWGDSETTEYFRQAYLIDPTVSARTIFTKKGLR